MTAEERLHIACFEWWQLQYGNRGQGLLFHPANGGSRHINKYDKNGKPVSFEATKLKRMGVTPGIPDLVLVLPYGRVCWFELKAPKGPVRSSQIAIHDRLRECGQQVYIVKSFDAFEQIVNALYLPPNP
jgi:hypothetical protein